MVVCGQVGPGARSFLAPDRADVFSEVVMVDALVLTTLQKQRPNDSSSQR
jgi:hypothetical protein